MTPGVEPFPQRAGAYGSAVDRDRERSAHLPHPDSTEPPEAFGEQGHGGGLHRVEADRASARHGVGGGVEVDLALGAAGSPCTGRPPPGDGRRRRPCGTGPPPVAARPRAARTTRPPHAVAGSRPHLPLPTEGVTPGAQVSLLIRRLDRVLGVRRGIRLVDLGPAVLRHQRQQGRLEQRGVGATAVRRPGASQQSVSKVVLTRVLVMPRSCRTCTITEAVRVSSIGVGSGATCRGGEPLTCSGTRC